MKSILTIILTLLLFNANSQDRSKWFEFYLPWNDSSRTVTDMSAYLDAPAGKHGFLKVTSDGHFRFEKKAENERFVGVVNVALANFPSKTDAKTIAARMAKFGINLVRIHLMDVEGTSGLFQNSAQNTLQISTDRLDKMDYFIKCLKDKGIYYNFCIHAGRIYKTADGIDSPVKNEQSKYITLFDPKIINLQKDFAQKTIGHINPYTKLTYANDPAMISVELTNENSLFNGWFGWITDNIFGETTGGIGAFYSKELDNLFNTWLEKKYKTDDSLKNAWMGDKNVVAKELILNGSFEQNLQSWGTLVTGGAKGTIATDVTVAKHGTKSAKISVNTVGTEFWNVQLKSNNFKVEKGKDYKIGFYAKADVEKEVRLEVMENQTWKYVMGPAYTTSKEWKFYEFYFNGPFNSNAMILAFGWGKQTGNFWVDSVTVSLTNGVGLEEGESLAAKNIKRTKAAEMGRFSKQRVGDNTAFYFDLEKNYTEQLTGFLKNDLGVKCPVTFTNNYFGLASVYSQSQADYIDFHQYWDHPNFPNGWSDTNFTLNNKSVLLNPEGSTINKMSLTRVKNMPHVLSEYNHPYPYIFQTEMPSLLYAYGSFFDLDGIVYHAYYDYMNRYSQRYQDMFFDVAMQPAVMTQMLLAVPYRLNYIQKAKTFVEANYRTQDVFNNTRTYQDDEVINMENAEYGTSFLQQGFRHTSFEADSTVLTGSFTNPGKVITSDTEELKWDGNLGVFTVNNPYWQGATGYLGGKNIPLGNITISNVTTTDNLNFASIHLISLDSLPISKSKKMILLTSARLENEGLKWNETKTSLVSAGGTRALSEPVEVTIKFKSSTTDSLSVYMLNQTGKRADSLLINQSAADAVFILNKKTLWYEISNHIKKTITQGSKIEKRTEKYSMKALPNPGKDFSTIEFSFPDKTEASFIMYNAFGQMIMNEPVFLAGNLVDQKKLDVSKLGDGIYFYGFQFRNGKRIIDKLVVSK